MNKCAGILALTLLAGLVPAAARADVLDNQLHNAIGGKPPEVPSLVDSLKAKGYKNVGVLRFRVQRETRKPSYTAPLSGSLAERVENVLIIHNAPKEKDALGIIHNAGKEATENKVGAWYSSADARKKLFDLDYELAWGKKKVKADAFITGVLKTTKDRRQTTVTLQVITKDSTTPIELKTVTFKSDLNIIRGLGESVALSSEARSLLRKRSAKGPDVDDLAFQEILKQDQQDEKTRSKKQEAEKKEQTEKKQQTEKKEQTEKKGTVKPKRPGGARKPKSEGTVTPDSVGNVQLEMLVNGNPVNIVAAPEGSDVKWQVTSPAPGQTVAFRMTNNSADQRGVVIRVNGLSTYEKQKADPEACQKWVIDSSKRNRISGFYMPSGGGKAQMLPFKVVVGEEANKYKSAYADKAGLIEVDVFEKGPDDGDDEAPLKVSSRGGLSARGMPPSKERKARESYVSLRDAMIKSAGLRRSMLEKREILVPDEEAAKESSVEEVPFKNPIFVAHIAIKIVPAGIPQPDDTEDLSPDK
jgi:hypothetical protein